MLLNIIAHYYLLHNNVEHHYLQLYNINILVIFSAMYFREKNVIQLGQPKGAFLVPRTGFVIR